MPALLAAALAWAGGNTEQEPENWPLVTFTAQADANLSCAAQQRLVMGRTEVEVQVPIGVGDRYAIYDTVRETFHPAASALGESGALLKESSSTDEYTMSGSDVLGVTEGSARDRGSGAPPTASQGLAVEKGVARVDLSRYGEPTAMRLLLWKDGSPAYRRIEVRTSREFFPGEASLFAGTGGAYVVNALGFLYACLPTEGPNAVADQRAFRTAACTSLDDVIGQGLSADVEQPWTRFRPLAGLSDHQKVFYSTFQAHVALRRRTVKVDDVEVGVPILEWPDGAFEAIYRDRPAYTTAWLRYCFDQSRPLLAGLIDDSFRGSLGMIRVPLSSYKYNWRQYETVKVDLATGEGEGKVLAQAALRYLTWGMEYVLPSGGKVERPPFTATAVGEEDLERVRSWVLGAAGLDPPAEWIRVPTAAELQAVASSLAPGAADPEGLLAKIAPLSTTPYSVVGSPVAWVPGGVDTPRTFAYKLFERMRALRWYTALPGETRRSAELLAYFAGGALPALVAGSAPSYGEQMPPRLLRYDSGTEVVKPYQAGVDVVKLPQEPSTGIGPNGPDRCAGVDAAGLLSGILVMSGLDERVLSIANEPRAKDLRAYASMSGPAAGLDSVTGRPSFAVLDTASSVRSGAYRFSRADLERMTVLVPSLSLVQLGDLVLGPETDGCYELGIVVGTTGPVASRTGDEYDARAERAKIIVVSVNGTVGHVFAGLWEDGVFATDADAFQLRRLVRLRAGVTLNDLAARPAGEVDPITAERCAVAMDVTYAKDAYASGALGRERVEDHWIPNTGEMLGIQSIRLARIGEPFRSANRPLVQLLGLVDDGTEDHVDEGTSIWWNQGGDFELYADFSGRKELLAVLHREQGSKTYGIAGGSAGALAADGMAGSAGGLRLTGGRVMYVHSSGDRTSTGVFALRALEPTVAGDDVLLSFRVWEEGLPPADVTATATDFAAVYDKKLLWRANLYMAETDRRDWNELNRWVEGNEWNPAGGSGGQVVVPVPSTIPPLAGFWTDHTVAAAVAYSLGTHDSPDDYNRKMTQQRLILDYLIRNDALGYSESDLLSPLVIGWTETTAPPSKTDPHGGRTGVWASYAGGRHPRRTGCVTECAGGGGRGAAVPTVLLE